MTTDSLTKLYDTDTILKTYLDNDKKWLKQIQEDIENESILLLATDIPVIMTKATSIKEIDSILKNCITQIKVIVPEIGDYTYGSTLLAKYNVTNMQNITFNFLLKVMYCRSYNYKYVTHNERCLMNYNKIAEFLSNENYISYDT